MNNAITETAAWQTQYFLTVTSAYGTTSGQGWYNTNALAYAGVNSGAVSGGTGTQYVFSSWSGAASGNNYGQSNAITMNGPLTATASWQTQYQVTFAVSPSASGTTTPSGTNVWENAGSIPISVSANSGYYFSSWSATTGITITTPTSSSTIATIGGTGTITAAFVQLDHFTVTASGGGNIGTQTAGSSFSITITAKDVNGNNITGYTIQIHKTTFLERSVRLPQEDSPQVYGLAR